MQITGRRAVFRTSQLEEVVGEGRNPTANRTMGEIIAARFSRRSFLGGSMAATAISATVSPLALLAAAEARAQGTPGFAFDFPEVEAGVDADHHVAAGYDARILLRWGDPLFPDSPEFDPLNQTPEAQAKQFGYNNDYVGYITIEGSSEHGLLVVNHEYTNAHLMFPGIVSVAGEGAEAEVTVAPADQKRVDIEMAAHGGTIVEIEKADGVWSVVRDGRKNRRITATTEMAITGPAAGHPRLQTSADAERHARSSAPSTTAPAASRPGAPTSWPRRTSTATSSASCPKAMPRRRTTIGSACRTATYEWGNFYDRYDISKEPNEPNRFGWIVEVDVEDPTSLPRKRTALGRFKHEGAESIVNGDGRVVFYLGDDERFDYVYKFVTAGTFNPDDRAANMDLLDAGTLYVARFDEGGAVAWLPLVHGEGPLTEANGFASQADVLIETRRAADLLEATPMDRPEDIEPDSGRGRVYVMLTNNTRREEANPANPRIDNAFGHIIEIAEANGDFAATEGTWEILLKCGDPSVAEVGATFSTETTANGWFGMPDNCAIDADGRLWVATDGNSPGETGRTDGLWAVGTEGEAARTSRLFYRVPVGGELCGPMPTPDLATFFVAVQHPGDGGDDWEGFGRPSYFEDPSTRWPDFADGMPMRPSVVAITRQGGGKIGA